MSIQKAVYQPPSFATSDNNERLGFLADIAAFYYEDGLTQPEIGKLIGISTAMVSRFLAEAREKGVVEIKVNHPYSISSALQSELVQHFGLRTVRVLVANSNETIESRLRRIGELAARFLQTIVTDHAIITVAWGKTIFEVVQATRGSGKQGIKVIQASGALGGVSSPTDNHALTQELARRLGGQPYHIHAPMVMENRQLRDALLQDPNLSHVLQLGRQSDIVLMGIGVPLPEFSNMYLAGYISAEVLEAFRREGAVGDIGAHFFDIYGERCMRAFSDRVIGIRLEDIRQAKHSILVAAGDYKVPAILGALRMGDLNVLITDQPTAEGVLELEKEYPLDERGIERKKFDYLGS